MSDEEKPRAKTDHRRKKKEDLERASPLYFDGTKSDTENKPEVKKRGRPKGTRGTLRPDITEGNIQPGDNSRYIRHSLEIAKLPRIDMSKPEEVSERIVKYFEICDKNDMKPHLPGLALALGTDRSTLYDIRNSPEAKLDDVGRLLQKTVVILDGMVNDLMQNGKINPVSGIFLMKNHFAYRNESEIVVKPAEPLGAMEDTKALEERYAADIILDPSAVTEHKDE